MTAAVKIDYPVDERLTVVCSLDLESQMQNALGAVELFRQWTEEEGCNGNIDAFMREVCSWIQHGSAWLCVVWEGEVPVGMCSMHIHYDAFQSRFRAWGERLYVTPSHRNMRVFRAIWASGELFTRLSGATEQVVTSRNPVLGKWYERAGYVETDRIYKKLT